VADSAGFDERPVRAFRPDPDRPVAPDRWPASVPAAAHLLRDGLELPAGLTVLVGRTGQGSRP
jgi:predicted ATPase